MFACVKLVSVVYLDRNEHGYRRTMKHQNIELNEQRKRTSRLPIFEILRILAACTV